MDAKELKAKENQGNFELRRRAEESLKEATNGSKDLSGLSPERMANLIHELEVHQIELKMQNDELRRIQGELEKTRDRYSHLYDFSPVGYFTMSEMGTIEEVNLTGAGMIGIERSALIGKPFARFVLREDQDIFYMHRQRLLETETPQSCELRLVKKDGHEFYSRMESIVIKNRGEKLRQIRASVSDVTEHKMAEALRESEEKFRRFFEDDLTGDYITTADGVILDCNPAFLRILGYKSKSEAVGESITALYPELSERGSIIDQLRVTGKLENYETTRKRKDCILITVNENIVATLDEDCNIVEIKGYLYDITERKRAEEELRESEERYRALFEYNSIETIIVDNEAKIMMYNFAKEKSGGRLPKIGDVMYEDYAGKHQINMFEELMECITSGDQKEFPDLKYKGRFLNIRISPFSGGAIISSIDITERKKLEAQLRQSQKLEALGTLAGGIAHEFNNVLGIIIVNTELAADDIPERNPAKECIEEIRKASMRATDVVMQLLSFARKSLIEKKPTPITHIVKETLKLVRASIPTTIEITQNLSCESDTVLADPTQISQVLINLCTNAKDAMAEEGGILKVSLANEEFGMRNVKLNLAPGKYVKLSISDTGRGIEPEIIDSIFEPFFTTKGRTEGTGMGLSVAHGIVKSYGGDISVKSEIGKGSVFEMLLPCVEADMQAQTETGMKKFPGGNERILVVDDEEGLVRAYTFTLKSLGYDVISCTSAEEALKIYRERHDEIDLVITDMTMPVMPGDRLAQELTKFRPDVPIILCTGYSDRMDEDKAGETGITALVMKPISRDVLSNKVREVLDEAKSWTYD